MSNRVFVGKVSQNTTEQTLSDEFSKFGEVTKIDLKGGYAFVFYENDNDCIEAINNLDGKEIDGNNIVVEAARSARDYKQKPVKRLDLRLSVTGLESRISWQDLKDWARKAGDVTFTNIFMRDDSLRGIIEFMDAEGMENALRTLEDVPLKGLNLRLEKDDSVNGGGGAGDRPFRADHQRPRYNDGPPQGGPRGGYDDRFGPGGPRGYDRDSRDSRGGYERGPYGGGGDRYHHGPPMDRFDGPPPYRGGGYADYRMGGPGGPDPRGGGGYRGDRRGPPMDGMGGPPPMGGGGYYPPHRDGPPGHGPPHGRDPRDVRDMRDPRDVRDMRDGPPPHRDGPPHREGRSRSRSRSRDRGNNGERFFRGPGGPNNGPGHGGHGPPAGGMYPPHRGGGGPYERGPPGGAGGPGPYERGPPPAGGGRYFDGPNRGGGGGGGHYGGGMR